MGNVTVTCQHCKQRFETWAIRIKQGKGKYCSKACYDAAQSTPFPTYQQFMDNTEYISETNCWKWKGHLISKGYPVFRSNGEIYRAHRVAWEFKHKRPLPSDMYACHTCDNPWCVNPEHIYAGDAQTNRQDAVRRNRIDRGKLKTNALITPEIVKEIRTLCQPHKSYTNKMKELSAKYGIAYTTVRDIVWRRTWKGVE